MRESGGLVSDLSGGEDYIDSGRIVAGNAKVLRDLLKTLRPSVRAMTAAEAGDNKDSRSAS